MELQFKTVENDLEWDNLVFKLPKYSFLLSSARFNYEKELGGEVLKFAIYEGEKFIGLVYMSIGNSKIFGKYMECKHSPMLIDSKVEYWESIFLHCKKIAKENKCFMIRFSPLYVEDSELNSFYNKNNFKKAPIHNVDALVSQHIDLSKDLEELRRDMNKTKRNLLNRLLNDSNAKVSIFKDNSQFNLFKDFHEQTTKLKGYTDKPVGLLLKELEAQVKSGMCHMIVGYYQDRPIGLWQCTIYGNNMHLYQAGTDTEFRDKNINITYLLYWEALKLGKELGCSTFDLFGGVVPDNLVGKNHPWEGVGAFKESLGGTKITYMHSRDYVLNIPLYTIYYYYSWFRTTLKGYSIDW
jgi:lipid II:glycine glycyltransferase (peptidoglycan interpeptide bridge formation enzyme)